MQLLEFLELELVLQIGLENGLGEGASWVGNGLLFGPTISGAAASGDEGPAD